MNTGLYPARRNPDRREAVRLLFRTFALLSI